MKFREVTWYSQVFALILFVALPFIGFYAGMKYQQAIAPSGENTSTASAKPNGNQTGWETLVQTNQITVRTKYENGVLKYAGTVQVPTPCYKLKDETAVLESYPEQVQIRLSIVQTRGICAQVISKKEFSGEVKVSEEAVTSVFLNGERVE